MLILVIIVRIMYFINFIIVKEQFQKYWELLKILLAFIHITDMTN
jgi:hypothetical protein